MSNNRIPRSGQAVMTWMLLNFQAPMIDFDYLFSVGTIFTGASILRMHVKHLNNHFYSRFVWNTLLIKQFIVFLRNILYWLLQFLVSGQLQFKKPSSLARDRSAWQAVAARTRMEHNLRRAFVDGLIDNDEEVASFKKHTQFKTRVHKPYPISDQSGQNRYPISDQNG